MAARLRAIDEAEEQDEATEDIAAYRRPPAPRQPSQVYSIRMPVERLAELRHYADEEGLTPSALMRQLVLHGLARRTHSSSEVDRLRDRVTELEERMTAREKAHGERVDQAVAQISTGLSTLLTKSVEGPHQ